MDQTWRIQTLGGLRAECGERVVDHFYSQKATALLAWLAKLRLPPWTRQLDLRFAALNSVDREYVPWRRQFNIPVLPPR